MGKAGTVTRHMDVRRIVAGIGRTFIAAGVLILLFVAYQLWGTGLAEARSQDRLRSDFLDAIETPRSTTTTTSTDTSDTSSPDATTTTQSAAPPTPTGEAVAIIRIPKIGVEKAVVEGVGLPDLKKGPGHYPTTPLPGQAGNAAIAGHRTTYGAPFFNIDQLSKGDPILFTTREGHHFEYDVLETKVVKPTDVSVVDATQDNRLTLTTCNPRYSAAQRLVVVAALKGELVDPPSAPVTGTVGTTPTTLPARDPALGGDSRAWPPSILWGLFALLVGFGIWLAGHRRKKWLQRWAIYAALSPALLVVMFFWFQQVNRLLPSNI